jgi:opacity protein-like surface antigen
MKKQVMTMLSLLVLTAGAASAQSSLTLKLGGSFPMGDFADATVDYDEGIERWGLWFEDHSKKGGAGLGFMLGAEWQNPIAAVQGLSVTVSLDAIYNGLNGDLNDYFNEVQDNAEDELDEYNITSPRYINVPLMLGLNYNYNLGGNLGLYAGAGLGANLRVITPFAFHEEGREGSYRFEVDENVSYSTAVSFAFRLGAGITINDKYSLGIEYYALGASKVKWEMEETEYYAGDTDREHESGKSGNIAPTMLLLRLGIKL